MVMMMSKIFDFLWKCWDNSETIFTTTFFVLIIGGCTAGVIYDCSDSKILYRYQYNTTNTIGTFNITKDIRGDFYCNMVVKCTLPVGSYETTLWTYGHRAPDHLSDITKFDSDGTMRTLFNGNCINKINIVGIVNDKLISNEFTIPYNMTSLGPVNEIDNEIKTK